MWSASTKMFVRSQHTDIRLRFGSFYRWFASRRQCGIVLAANPVTIAIWLDGTRGRQASHSQVTATYWTLVVDMAESVEPPNASSDSSPTPPEPAPSPGASQGADGQGPDGPGLEPGQETVSGPASSPTTFMDAEIEQEVPAAMEAMSTE